MKCEIKLQLVYQLLNNCILLKILLAEICIIRLHDVKKLGHDQRNAAKMTRSKLTFHNLIEVAEIHPYYRFFGVHFSIIGIKKGITPRFFEHFKILLKCSGIF